MKELLKYIKPYKKEILLAVSLVFLEVIAEVTMPKLMSKIVNIYLPEKNMNKIK